MIGRDIESITSRAVYDTAAKVLWPFLTACRTSSTYSTSPDLKGIRHPTLVVQGFDDEMIPVRNSYWLAENLPNAVLLAYPDAGHGSRFQYSESFTKQATAFLSSDSASAVF